MAGQRKKKPKPIQTRDRAETEARLVAAAIEVFAEHGFDGATTRLIAEKAQSNIGLVNRYFKNKEGLLIAVLKSYRTKFAEIYNYPAQSSLLDESLYFAKSRIQSTSQVGEIYRVVLVQGILDNSFLKAIDPAEFDHPEMVYTRFRALLEKDGFSFDEESVRAFIDTLDRIIQGTLIFDMLMTGLGVAECTSLIERRIKTLLVRPTPRAPARVSS